MIRLKSLLFLIFFLGVFCGSVFSQKKVDLLAAPAGDKFTQINQSGISILPSGRLVKPAGSSLLITDGPYGMALSPDGTTAVTLHNGVFTIIDVMSMAATRVPSYDKKLKSPLSKGSFLGVAFAKDSKTIYLSGGDNGAVISYDIQKLTRLDSISLNGVVSGKEYVDSFTSDLILNESNNELLVLDRGNFRMVRIDLTTKKITASIPVGRQPFGLSISPDHQSAFVANVGMYSYPLITGTTPANFDSIMISQFPYGDNTKESINGTVVEGRKIPGVGSPLNPDAMSVFTIDLKKNLVIDKFKTGHQIGHMVEGAEVVGGASPNSIAVGSTLAYVSNATNDNISILDYINHKIIGHIPIKVDPRIDHYRGLLPFGLTLSRDEKTLYVALLGFNAVAVIDVQSRTTKGLIPSGWGPTRVLLSKDESEIYITTCRGLGAGPNGGKGFITPPQGSFISDIQLGSFHKVTTPDGAQLASYTKQCIDNTFVQKSVVDDKNPLPPLPGIRKSPIKYVVYITKENRTYDEVFGQLKNAAGDSTLSRFGINCEYMFPDSTRKRLANLRISPNHIKAAKQFAFSDNYYCDSDASIHGHHWMVGVLPNEWVEANAATTKTAKLFSSAPGRRWPGTGGAVDPEDFGEIGGLWEALERSKVSFYNFGEANETAHVRDEWYDTKTGASHVVMVPMQKALFKRTSLNYAGFNVNIPDQYRMDQFEKEFTDRWIKGKEKLPSFLAMQVPNDHCAGKRPADGYFYPHSFMVDNDLAVGRILHFLSRTKYWKQMLVIITEDDPQGGSDHIDAHRSILMMEGPYVKKGYVSHNHANFGSILKTIYNILNVKYVNQFDVTASLLQDFFTDKPDFTPYTLEKHDSRIFNADLAMKRYNKTIDWQKIEKGPDMDDEENERDQHDKK
jgi:DNA-binding beta-propeller fold protein YncE